MGRIIEDSLTRRMIRDSMAIAKNRSIMCNDNTIDITVLHEKMNAFKVATGLPITTFTCVLYAYAQTLAKFPQATGMLDWRNRICIFDDIDILVPKHILDKGEASVGFMIVKKANHLGFKEFVEKVDRLSREPFSIKFNSQRLFLSLPDFIRHIFYKLLNLFPSNFKYQMGNSFCTYLKYGAILNTHETISASSSHFMHTISLVAINHKYKPETGRAINRLFLSLNVDHRVIDGVLAGKLSRAIIDQLKNPTFLDIP